MLTCWLSPSLSLHHSPLFSLNVSHPLCPRSRLWLWGVVRHRALIAMSPGPEEGRGPLGVGAKGPPKSVIHGRSKEGGWQVCGRPCGVTGRFPTWEDPAGWESSSSCATFALGFSGSSWRDFFFFLSPYTCSVFYMERRYVCILLDGCCHSGSQRDLLEYVFCGTSCTNMGSKGGCS